MLDLASVLSMIHFPFYPAYSLLIASVFSAKLVYGLLLHHVWLHLCDAIRHASSVAFYLRYIDES